jgi:hypothetical protein
MKPHTILNAINVLLLGVIVMLCLCFAVVVVNPAGVLNILTPTATPSPTSRIPTLPPEWTATFTPTPTDTPAPTTEVPPSETPPSPGILGATEASGTEAPTPTGGASSPTPSPVPLPSDTPSAGGYPPPPASETPGSGYP